MYNIFKVHFTYNQERDCFTFIFHIDLYIACTYYCVLHSFNQFIQSFIQSLMSLNYNCIGELRTWINTDTGAVVKEETITSNGRFALDPDQLFLFSSAQTSMMSGNIAIRTVRVEMCFCNDKDVKTNRARDKVSYILSVMNNIYILLLSPCPILLLSSL